MSNPPAIQSETRKRKFLSFFALYFVSMEKEIKNLRKIREREKKIKKLNGKFSHEINEKCQRNQEILVG
jgi:dynactin complex subunit